MQNQNDIIGQLMVEEGGGGYAAAVLADSPFGYWNLDEGSGVTFADSSGNGYDLTKAGTPTMGVAPLINSGKCIDILVPNTDYGYRTIPNGDTLFASQNLSIETWVNLDEIKPGSSFPADISAFFHIGNTWSHPNQGFYFGIVGGGKLGFYTLDGTWQQVITTSQYVTSTGTTYHVGVSVDTTNDEVKFYVNGALKETIAYTKTISSPSGNLPRVTVGGVWQDNVGVVNGMNGRQDETAYYKSVLSAARFLAHYNAGI